MITNKTEVLHSENHSKLSAEEIAKAVARHNRHHPASSGGASAKPKKVSKS
jgi:hypothetical protein